MTRAQTLSILTVVALGIGFGAGYGVHSMTVEPVAAVPQLDVPTDEQATAAMRKVSVAETGKILWPKAIVKLGQCNRSTNAAGVVCIAEFNGGNGGQITTKQLQFARIKNEWVAP
ncbi:hypothetical protein [Phyllobacterium sophorae]|uniref:Uncharacterized protein n=1 Tax=Phyllobacterium sophorae TaxID=1520277 RepID=A0A2P7B376_9HYPH|nr:hypothetical protein [Phyllobacterium sophorae]PSH60898.1 hypothetical protein CU103_25380 [Phyllobacterium sophorae]